jgi:hypothetical protein
MIHEFTFILSIIGLVAAAQTLASRHQQGFR